MRANERAKMPSSTSKSRPMARSYTSSPGLHQQRFESRRRSVKVGNTDAAADLPGTKQNTLTQMDFVRFDIFDRVDNGEELEYIQYESEHEREMQPEVKREEASEQKAGIRAGETRYAPGTTALGRGKSKSKSKRKRKREVKKEKEEAELDEVGEGSKVVEGAEENGTKSNYSAKRTQMSTSHEKAIRWCDPSSPLWGISTVDLVMLVYPWTWDYENWSVEYVAGSVQFQYLNAGHEKDGQTKTLSLPLVEDIVRQLSGCVTTEDWRMPLQPKSPNPQVSAVPKPIKQTAKRPAFYMPPTPHVPARREPSPPRKKHIKVDPEQIHLAGEVRTGSSPALPKAQQMPGVDRTTDQNLSRYSDPGLTIPDSEDEAETQDTRPGPATSPELPPTCRLVSQKSFSQATTVDATQFSQRPPPTQPTTSTWKGIQPSSSPIGTQKYHPHSNFMPPPSSLNSDTSVQGGNGANPITESQLLPDSLMNFELPRLPGWSQNIAETEDV